MILQKYLTSLAMTYLYGSPIKQIKPILVFGGGERIDLSQKIYDSLNKAGHKTGLFKRNHVFSFDKKLTNAFDEVPYNAELQQFLIELVREKCEYVVLELDEKDLEEYRLVLSEPILSIFLNSTCDESCCDRLVDFAAESTKSLIYKDHSCKEMLNDTVEKHKKAFEFCDSNFFEIFLKDFNL